VLAGCLFGDLPVVLETGGVAKRLSVSLGFGRWCVRRTMLLSSSFASLPDEYIIIVRECTV
jgi:hypothetical protein